MLEAGSLALAGPINELIHDPRVRALYLDGLSTSDILSLICVAGKVVVR